MTFEDPWPQNPRLDPFRDSIWELRSDGEVIAYVTTSVERVRSFPAFWVKREQLWHQVHGLDGRRDGSQVDYGPGWDVIAELEQGRFDPMSDGQAFEAIRVEDPERSRLWAQYGPPAC